ncbi:hypothetical protein ABZV93_08030 [Actinopolymorpha sp. NPDC004070]|uniref:hypothetical protein n=1 Tax=Actinopolymorpha sp. NPDC004070 TaxID=3154548 RepID=UPI0033B23BB7
MSTPLPPPTDPPPGLARLRRRLGDRTALRDDLLARMAAVRIPPANGGGSGGDPMPLGSLLDVAGDPTVVTLADLWSRVADGVSAYAELDAGELYLGTAQDWTDVRRLVDLIGYRPAQRTAAQGFVRAEIAPGSSPLLPAGTRVQAPGTPEHDAQTYEVAADTQLHPEWHGLTVTGVPAPAAPAGRQIRFLADPGFRPPDQMVLVSESGTPPAPSTWEEWIAWLVALMTGTAYYGSTGMAVRGTVRITKRSDDLGATLFDTDRSLAPLLPQTPGTSYAAYRLRAELTLAYRLDTMAYVSGNTAATVSAPYPSGEQGEPWDATSVLVLEAGQVSVGQTLILYAGKAGNCLVTTVASITPLDRHVAPGTVRRVARLELAHPLPNVLRTTGLTVLLADERHVAQHYELPALDGNRATARLHPRIPDLPGLPERLAVRTVGADGRPGWELTRCTASALDAPGDPGGRLVSLADARTGRVDRGAATGNVAPIRHGATGQGPLTLIPAAGAGGSTAIVTGPVTGDVGPDGTVTNSLVIYVDGVRFDEVPSLYGRGPTDLVYATRLAADGRLVLAFGDGVTGALPRGEVRAVWRTGGGLAGEIPSADIDTLVTGVNGVRTIAGVGPLTGAADQEDPPRMRRGAGARIRALDRAVGMGDLRDLALTVPGTTHAVAWRGSGPSGCACGGSGLHVAVLRGRSHGVRAPVAAELVALSGYLDARRDTAVPLCVCAAVASAVTVTADVFVGERRIPAVVESQVRAALVDPAGVLGAGARDLGVPLDGSDVVAVVQPVPGVSGISGLQLTGGLTTPAAGDLSLGRLPAEPYELLHVVAAGLGVRTA